MTTFDSWYAEQTGHKDRDQMKRAWDAAIASRVDSAAVREARQTLKDSGRQMVIHRGKWERVVADLLPAES